MPRKRVSQFTVRPRLPRVQAAAPATWSSRVQYTPPWTMPKGFRWPAVRRTSPSGTAVGQGRQADAVFHIEAAGEVGPAEDGVKKGLLFFVGHAAASVAVSAGASSSLTSSPRTT